MSAGMTSSARRIAARDDRRHVGLERAVADDADRDLLLEVVGVRLEQVDLGEVVLGRLDRPDVALQAVEVDLDRVRVRLAAVDLLHVGVAPAGVDPQLDVVEALDLVVERVDHEVEQLGLLRVEARP